MMTSVSLLLAALLTPAFSFDYRGTTYHGVPEGWVRTQTRSVDAGGTRSYVKTRAEEPGTGFALEIVETHERDLPVVEWEVSFTNAGTADSGRLTRLSSVDWNVPLGDGARELWHGVGETGEKSAALNYSFTRTAVTNGMSVAWASRQGYPCYFAFPYFRLSDATNCYTVALGYQGQWAGAATCRDGVVNLRAGQETVDFYLKPGESAISPKVTVLVSAPGDAAVNAWRQFMRERILPRDVRDSSKPLGPMLNLSIHEGGCLETRTSETGQVAGIRRVVEAGLRFDTLWVDAGWYTRTSRLSADALKDPLVWYKTAGDWSPDPERLPNGFAPIARELEKVGARLVLWYEPERLWATNAFVATARPYLYPAMHGNCLRYDFTRPEAVDFIANVVAASQAANDVAVYRQDSNGTGPLPFWLDCERARNDGRRGFAENLAVRGSRTFWEKLRARRPSLVFDTCASGGRRNDLSTLRFPSVPLHYTDIGWRDPIARQRHKHMLFQWGFYHKNLSSTWSRGGAFNRAHAVADLAPFQSVKEANYLGPNRAAERKLIEIWRRNARYFIDGDYYLLSGERFGDDRWWVTEFRDPRMGGGFFQVVRNPASKDATFELCPCGIPKGKTVRCQDLYSGRVTTVSAGASFSVALAPGDGTVIKFSEN